MKILLKGKPKVGKSTVLQKFIDLYHGSSVGIIIHRMKDSNGFNHGFKAITLDGRGKIIAHRELVNSNIIVGNSHKVDIKAIDEFVVSEISKGLDERKDLIIIDEIGRMQSFSNKFLATVSKVQNSESNILATIVYDPEPWSLEFKNNKHIILVEVTELNRDILPESLSIIFSNAKTIEKLTQPQKQIINKMLSEYLQNGQLLMINKLFNNAISYFLEKKIRKTELINHYKVNGKHGSYTVKRKGTKYLCTCDLYNGRAEYNGIGGDCSHIQAVKILMSH